MAPLGSDRDPAPHERLSLMDSRRRLRDRRPRTERSTMNAHRFDALTRSLAAGASRRRVLKVLAGLASGGLLASPLLVRAVGAPCEADADCPGD